MIPVIDHPGINLYRKYYALYTYYVLKIVKVCIISIQISPKVLTHAYTNSVNLQQGVVCAAVMIGVSIS